MRLHRSWIVGLGCVALHGCATFLDDDLVASAPADAGADGIAPPALSDGGGPDAAPIPAVPCPAACTSCAGGTCVVQGSKKLGVVCPTGMACRVECASKDACESIRCAPGQPCTIRCTAKDACNGSRIEGNSAASLCLFCGGDPGCNGLSCASLPATCQKVCRGAGCNGLAACNVCKDTADCP